MTHDMHRYADRLDLLCILLGLIGAIGNGILMPLFTVIFGDILNAIGLNIFNPSALKSQVSTTVPKFMYLGAAALVASIFQTFFLVAPSVRQVNRLRATYLRRVLVQDVSFFDTEGTSGFVLQGLNEDCLAVQTAIGERLSMFVFMISTAAAGLIIAFIRGWQLTLIIIAFLPVLAATGFAISILVQRLTSSMNRAYADANTLAQQALGNVRTVYAYNGEERTVHDYDAALYGPLRVGIKQGFYSGITTGMANCVAYCGYALAMWYGARLVSQGDYNGGQVLNVLLSALIGGFALGQAVPNWQDFHHGQVAAARIQHIMRRYPVVNIDAPGKELEHIDGHVEITHVSFAYPARPDKPVFVDFSLSVPAGQTVALVGESGSGKSTVIQLIERFYDPQSGSVLLDGVDLRDLNLRWLRSQIGLVSQEPTLFATSIRHNMLLGKPDATPEELEAAAKAANAHAFISALPEGYDTKVGEKGVQMSGGQKQRIAIARALLKDPRVLLLDEATSALDAKSEHVVQEALDRLMEGRTTVVVAHRLSTVVNSDCIAVVKQGRVVEQGAHHDLMQLDGAYKTLVQMQGSGGHQVRTEASSGNLSASEGSAEGMVTASQRRLKSYPPKSESSKVLRTSTHVLETTEAGLSEEITENKNEDSKELAPGSFEEIEVSPEDKSSTMRKNKKLSWHLGIFRRRTGTNTSKRDDTMEERRDDADDKDGAKKADAEEVPLSRIAQLNRPELPALFGGLLGSTAMGLIMPFFSLVFSSLVGVFFLTRE